MQCITGSGRFVRRAFVLLALLGVLIAGDAMQALAASASEAGRVASLDEAVVQQLVSQGLVDELRANGKAEGIVVFDGQTGRARADAVRATEQKIAALRRGHVADEGQALDDVPGLEVRNRLENLPVSVVSFTSEDALLRVLNAPHVDGVTAPTTGTVDLAQSLPQVRADSAKAAGHTGAGTYVAVLDTGVDYTRAAFGSCTAPNSSTSCKVFFVKDYAPNDSSLDDDRYLHGTNVSGIVTGVAPGTRIFGLDVFQKNADGDNRWDSRWILAALNDVLTWKGQGYNIRAVNMSLGIGNTFQPDNCTSTTLGYTNEYTSIFADLRAAKVLPVASAGNSAYGTGSFRTGIGYPGCTAGAVNVGAVYDANMGGLSFSKCTDSTTARDQVTCFSQTVSGLSILAPGSQITAAGVTNNGTSQAAPHVAGAAAVLAAASPGATASQIETALTTSGPWVTDHRTTGIATRRLDVVAALDAIGGSDSTPPTLTTPTHHPTGRITTVVPTRVLWGGSDASGIAAYEVYVRVNGGSWQRVTLSSATVTSVTLDLTPGTKYEFAVRAKDAAGNWSGYAYDAPFVPAVVDDRSSALSYSSGWARQSWTSAYNGTVTASNATSAYARYTFSGSAVAYVASLGNNRGQANIYVDGVLKKTVDLYSSTGKGATVAYSFRWNTAGTHTVDVQVVGTSGRPTIDLDAFVVLK